MGDQSFWRREPYWQDLFSLYFSGLNVLVRRTGQHTEERDRRFGRNRRDGLDGRDIDDEPDVHAPGHVVRFEAAEPIAMLVRQAG